MRAVGAAYADASPVRLDLSHSSGIESETATRRGENVADGRAAMVTVVIVVAAGP